MLANCAGVLRALESEQGVRLARSQAVSSTELLQKEEAAEEDGEGNPEVDVGGDGTQEVERNCAVGWIRQCFNLQNSLLESGVPS